MDCRPIIEKLRKEQDAQMEELRYLLEHLDEESSAYLRAAAAEEAVRHFGRKIYLRGLIEFTNYCKNDCLYCGIRRGNQNAVRYRLTLSQIMECCKMGYELGYRTLCCRAARMLISMMNGCVRSFARSRKNIRTVQ